MSQTIYIRNMVCPRCIMAVEKTLNDLTIPFLEVKMGQAELAVPLDVCQTEALNVELKKLGFELLEKRNRVIISKIKTFIVQQIPKDEPATRRFSELIADHLHYDYSYLSRLFSSVEGITIEKFIARQKIEKVKELLFYDELSLSEIALRLNYSSVAYLSSQFKKETGMTPTRFKENHRRE